MERTSDALICLAFLGTPLLTVAGKPLALPARKHWALLLFLATHDEAIPRKRIAELLWGMDDPVAARGNLRMALNRLPSTLKQLIEVRRDTLAWRGESFVDVDLIGLDQSLRGDDPEPVLARYRGNLLGDFVLDDAPAFGDWLLQQREGWRQRVYDFLGRVGESRLALHDYVGAGSCAQSWLERDPTCEVAHQLLIRALLAQGQREAAQRQYRACAAALAVGLGRTPAAETTALMMPVTATAAARELVVPRRGRIKLVKAAVAATAMFGRDAQVLELMRLLDEPGCRLLSLHGPGGVGKTRLAHALAESVAERAGSNVLMLGCETITPDRNAWLVELANALEIQSRGAATAVREITSALGRRGTLVILDNFESLLSLENGDGPAPACAALSELLVGAPGLRVVVTTRERLNIQEEWLVPVTGLSTPPENASAGQCRGHAAVRLYESRARQVRCDYALGTDIADVAALTRLVDGMPLALELAAGWIDELPAAAIVADWRSAIGTLSSPTPDRPARHRNLAAVVEWSWKRLDVAGRAALCMLSLLPGGATAVAMEGIGFANPGVLQRLVERALLRRHEDRYLLHPVVTAFARDQPFDWEAGRRRVGEWFAGEVFARTDRLRRGGDAEVTAWFNAEQVNITRCWHRATLLSDATVLDRMAGGLLRHCLNTGRVAQGLEAARTHRVLAAARTPPAVREICLALAHEGAFLDLQGDAAAAETCYRSLFTDMRPGMFPVDQVANFRTSYGWILRNLGKTEAVIEQAHLALAETGNEGPLAWRAHSLLAATHGVRADWEKADYHSEQACALARNVGSLATMTRVYRAEALIATGKLDDALALLHDVEAQCRHDGARFGEGWCLLSMAHAYSLREDWSQCRLMAIRAEAIGCDLGIDKIKLDALLHLASASLANGLPHEALAHATQALGLADETDTGRPRARAFHGLARVYAALGDDPAAIEAYRNGLLAVDSGWFECLIPLAVDAALMLRERGRPEARAILADIAASPHASFDVRSHLKREGIADSAKPGLEIEEILTGLLHLLAPAPEPNAQGNWTRAPSSLT